MLFGLPRRQRLPKSSPQLHIRLAAAQTRTVSAALFRPNPRKLWRQFKWISFLTDSGVRISYAQASSPARTGRAGPPCAVMLIKQPDGPDLSFGLAIETAERPLLDAPGDHPSQQV